MEGGGLLLEFYDLFFVGVDEDSMVFFCGKLMILCGEKISIILFMGKPMILFGENCVILSRGISGYFLGDFMMFFGRESYNPF